jgi:hypothetical protein
MLDRGFGPALSFCGPDKPVGGLNTDTAGGRGTSRECSAASRGFWGGAGQRPGTYATRNKNSAGGAMIKRSWLRYFDEPPTPDYPRIIQSWDTAAKEANFGRRATNEGYYAVAGARIAERLTATSPN